MAVDEIDDPRVYGRSLQGSKVKIGSETIRNIPFRYAQERSPSALPG